MNSLAAYRKTITAVIGSVLTWAGVAYVPDGNVTRPEWFALALALATALGVYAVTNEPTPGPAAPAEPVALTAAGQVPLKRTQPRAKTGEFETFPEGARMAEQSTRASGE